jgi:hypothetical protein
LAIGDTSKIPRKGNYDEICAHGIEIKGVVESLGEDGDADDDHWIVRHFKYSHDGQDYHGVAYSMNGLPKAGDSVTVRYLGNQAVLPQDPPPDIDPTNNFLLVLIFSSVLLSPVLLVFFVFWLLSVFGRGKRTGAFT